MPLAATGFWQAGRLAERLGAEPIDAIVASDLARAWLTARPLAERLSLEPVADARLRERHFGRFQGHTLEEVATEWPEDLQHWRARDPAWPIPEGESGLQFIDRVLASLSDIVQAHPGRTVAVVTHGGALDVAYRHARNLSWDAPRRHLMQNCAINRLHGQQPPLQLTIEHWGDCDHLGQARDEL